MKRIIHAPFLGYLKMAARAHQELLALLSPQSEETITIKVTEKLMEKAI